MLISAATSGRADHLKGLKENVIIGRRIPVGTGAHALASTITAEDELVADEAQIEDVISADVDLES